MSILPDGTLEVRAPKGLEQAAIARYVAANEAEVRAQLVNQLARQRGETASAENLFLYALRRSERTSVSVEIGADGGLLVRAPLRMRLVDIERLLRERAAQIGERLRAAQRLPPAREPDDMERGACVERALRELPARVRHYEARMGVRARHVSITDARTRFGSCSSKDRLCFSWRLMRYPDAAIDAVVVHELAHIRHKDHGKAFYAFILSVLPDYREREKLLKAAPRPADEARP